MTSRTLSSQVTRSTIVSMNSWFRGALPRSAAGALLFAAAVALPCSYASAQVCTTGNVLTNPQFGPGTVLGSYTNATTYNQWLEEQATVAAGPVGCVVPLTPGTPGMLHLAEAGGSLSQVRQVVDVSGPLGSGMTTLVAKARFNSPTSGSIAGIGVSVWTGSSFVSIPGASASLALDGDCMTWEEITVCGQVPAGTQWLNFDLRYTNGTLPQGGFVDEASLELSVVSNDSCLCPLPISGFGAFAFDTTCATTDGLPDPLCDAFGTSDILDDVWMQWSAPSSGDFLFSTCAGTTGDTRIALYVDESTSGGTTCPTMSPLCCNDDSCGLQSEFCCPGLVGGQSYMIRVGNFAAGGGSVGNLTISGCGTCFSYSCFGDHSLDPTAPCPCSNYSAVGDDAGCLNSTTLGAILRGSGSCSIGTCDTTLTLSQVPANQFGIIYSGINMLQVTFGDGIRCVGGSIIRSSPMNTGPAGMITVNDVLCSSGLAGTTPLPGTTRHYQGWFRDPVGPCLNGFNFSNVATITIVP